MERTKRHPLSDLVAITLCGAICGADTRADVERFGNEKIAWFRTFLRLEKGVPSRDTFGRVFAALDTGQFYACLANWIASLQLDLRGQTVAIDGKTLRKSFDKSAGREALQVVIARPASCDFRSVNWPPKRSPARSRLCRDCWRCWPSRGPW